MVGIRIGVLHDFPIGDGGRSFEDFARRGMRHVTDGDRLSEDIEFVHAVGLGLPMPGGTARAVEDAFAHLIDEGVVAILGPAVSDSALVAQPLADRARIPCINYTGSDETRSEYMFQFQIGSLEDEPSFLADNLARRGLRRVALVRDRSYVGRRMADFLEEACAVEGITLVARQDADALVSLGMWDPAIALAAEGVARPRRGELRPDLRTPRPRHGPRLGGLGLPRHDLRREPALPVPRRGRRPGDGGPLRHGPPPRRGPGPGPRPDGARCDGRAGAREVAPRRVGRARHADGVRALRPRGVEGPLPGHPDVAGGPVGRLDRRRGGRAARGAGAPPDAFDAEAPQAPEGRDQKGSGPKRPHATKTAMAR